MDESNKNSGSPSDDSQSLDGSNNSIDTTDTGSSAPAPADGNGESAAPKKKGLRLPGPLQKYGHRFNIYLLLFVLIIVLAAAILVITAMASKKTKDPAAISSQALSSDALKQLSNSNATVGDPKQILNVQSNAVFAGKVMIRDSLEVAGQIKVGGPLSLPGITVSGESSFEQLSVNKSINIGGDASVQGQMNVKKNLAVSGGGTFGGALTAPQIATSNFQLLGDLTLTSHVNAGGATPGRTIGAAVGSGGTSSVSGSDTAGSININTGSSPAAGCFVTINFNKTYTATPHVLVTPIGSSAGAIDYYINRSSSNFSICASNTSSIPTNANFGFDYFVIN